MRFSGILPLLAWAASCAASIKPLAVRAPASELEVRNALALATRTEHLEKRLTADFSMTNIWYNKVLFKGSYIDRNRGIGNERVSLSVTCQTCYTIGTITTRLTSDKIIDPTIRFDFKDVEAFFDLNIATSTGGSHSINLFKSKTPLGLGFKGLSVGVVFFVDLVFSVDQPVDLSGGFYMQLANDAFLEASIFGGAITDTFFEGLASTSLPITVRSGAATLKADLRLRAQVGAETGSKRLGLGASAELGVYTNLIEFVTAIDSTPECPVRAREWWDLNIGAYAHLDVVVDYSTKGPVPTASTTLLTAPTLTQCLGGGGEGPEETGGADEGTPTEGVVDPVDPQETAALNATVTLRYNTTGLTFGAVKPSSVPTSVGKWNQTRTGDGTVMTTTPPPLVTSGITRFPMSNFTEPANGTAAGMVTSTLYMTSTYIVTACAANVVNCPSDLASEVAVTRTIDVVTLVLPAGGYATPDPADPAEDPAEPETTEAPAGLADLIERRGAVANLVTLRSVDSPVIQAFYPWPKPTDRVGGIGSHRIHSVNGTHGRNKTTTTTTGLPTGGTERPTALVPPVVDEPTSAPSGVALPTALPGGAAHAVVGSMLTGVLGVTVFMVVFL